MSTITSTGFSISVGPEATVTLDKSANNHIFIIYSLAIVVSSFERQILPVFPSGYNLRILWLFDSFFVLPYSLFRLCSLRQWNFFCLILFFLWLPRRPVCVWRLISIFCSTCRLYWYFCSEVVGSIPPWVGCWVDYWGRYMMDDATLLSMCVSLYSLINFEV